ncbi:hypothetical protein MNBD_GAMMA25-2185 [hydrothermal vent metagenome]|uniref:Uncharacterized protein n=1 Tax=hydrothermal vent metagenome TaxID=652676 RepID=A0A3B1BJ08_9ZZZZ
MMRFMQRMILLMLLGCFWQSAVMAVELQGFILAERSHNSYGRVNEAVLEKLKKNGFQVLGSYSPQAGVNIFVVTNRELKRVAAKSEYGGFGAVIKVSVARVTLEDGRKEVQVAYNNPEYMALAYWLDGRLSATRARLKKALGAVEDFGGPVDEDSLPDYNYTIGMEGFSGFFELASYGSYKEAVKSVETNLAKDRFGISQIFRLDIPGKKQTLFGLGMKANVEEHRFINDEYVMEIIDHQQPRRIPHLPYEILVIDNRVIGMHPHFRIAISFPDLHMFGEHGFGRMIQLPYDYEEFIIRAIGAQWPPDDDW